MFGTGGRFNFTGTMDKLLHIAYNRDMSCTRGRGEGRIPHRKEWNVMEELLDALLRECQPYTAHGKVATYIPELAKGDPSDLGIYVCLLYTSSSAAMWPGQPVSPGSCWRWYTVV